VRDSLRVKKEIDYKPKILDLIKKLDEGNGVEIVKIFELSSLPENVIESAINELLAKGLLFEPKPAVLKVV
jgi:predicted transcriptional regulator